MKITSLRRVASLDVPVLRGFTLGLAVVFLGVWPGGALGVTEPLRPESLGTQQSSDQGPFREDSLVFPLDDEPLATLHNHGSSLVEAPDGSLLVVWFSGSGERKADDVKILGARKAPRAESWGEPFVAADTPGFPDTNCTLLVDSDDQLWLFYPTIQDNRWESALLKVKVSDDWIGSAGVPGWTRSEVVHMKPGEDFAEISRSKMLELFAQQGLDTAVPGSWPEQTRAWFDHNVEQASDKLTRRLGWFTRAHPYLLDRGTDRERLVVGLYSDGFSFGSTIYSDDAGKTWSMSEPIVGAGSVQPAFAQRRDGTLVAFLRDNGPPPKRTLVAESRDRSETWSLALDHPDLPESGAGVDALVLESGLWLVVHNDLVVGRHRLSISISEDEGRTFGRRAVIEETAPKKGRFHYPSIIQGSDGMVHLSFSYQENRGSEPSPVIERKTIKHVRFNEAWLLEAATPVARERP